MRNNKIYITLFITIIMFFACSVFTSKKPETNHVIFMTEYTNFQSNKSPSLVMFDCLEKYSDKYGIPKHIIYNISFLETRYQGPFDWNYKHNLGSFAGALGPMQVMPSTANMIHKEKISRKKLKNDIDFNVETSAKLLRLLYDKYENWGKVCGAYNTGRPIINKYSKYCTSNLNYWENWNFFLSVD